MIFESGFRPTAKRRRFQCTKCTRRAAGMLPLLLLWAATSSIGAETGPRVEKLPVLTTAAAVHQLSHDEANRHYPVRLRGVVTGCEAKHLGLFVQDSTAGIWATPPPGAICPEPGQVDRPRRRYYPDGLHPRHLSPELEGCRPRPVSNALTPHLRADDLHRVRRALGRD